MDPALIGRPLVAIAIALLIISIFIFPFQIKESVEYYVVIFSIIINAVFLVAVLLWIRVSSGEKKDTQRQPADIEIGAAGKKEDTK